MKEVKCPKCNGTLQYCQRMYEYHDINWEETDYKNQGYLELLECNTSIPDDDYEFGLACENCGETFFLSLLNK